MSMRNFIIRRCILMVPLFFGVCILSFVIVSLSPADIVDIETQGNANLTDDDKFQMKENLHFVTRPETHFNAETAEVSVESGWTPEIPFLRGFHYPNTQAVVRFDDDTVAPADVSPRDSPVTHSGFYNGSSASDSMRNATSLAGVNSVTIDASGWNYADEITIMFWMNWATTLTSTPTLFTLGSEISATMVRSTQELSITFTVDDMEVTWINGTQGLRNASLLPNEWHHYGFVANSQVMRIYVDGNHMKQADVELTSIPSAEEFVLGVSDLPNSAADDIFIFNKAILPNEMPAWSRPDQIGTYDLGASGNFQVHDAEDIAPTGIADGETLSTAVTAPGNKAWQIFTIDYSGIRNKDSSWDDRYPVVVPYVKASAQAMDSSLHGYEAFVWSTRSANWRSFGDETLNESLLENSGRLPRLRERWQEFLPTDNLISILVVSRERTTDTSQITLNVDWVEAGIVLTYDELVTTQFVFWMIDFLQGTDNSYLYHQPSLEVISTFAWETVKLQFAALILSLIIAVPVGVISATRQYSKIDNLSMTAALLGVSLPVFWTGLILLLIFSYYIPIFPTGGAYTRLKAPDFPNYGTWSIDAAMHMVLPTIILGTAQAALTTRLVRSSMLEVLRQDYIMTARSKGLTERIVVYKHALRNALLPVATIIGLSIGGLLAGAALTETVFNWPGLGYTAVFATIQRDYTLVLGINITLAMILIVANLLTDISYAFLDPRIRY